MEWAICCGKSESANRFWFMFWANFVYGNGMTKERIRKVVFCFIFFFLYFFVRYLVRSKAHFSFNSFVNSVLYINKGAVGCCAQTSEVLRARFTYYFGLESFVICHVHVNNWNSIVEQRKNHVWFFFHFLISQ